MYVHSSPSKAPVPLSKKGKKEEVVISNNEILSPFNNLKSMMLDFSSELKQNSVMIASIVKRVDLNSLEINECKEWIKVLEKQLSKLTKENAVVKERALELERYKLRWNLRISGLHEQD
ncbi:hypothetical protein QTP86_003496, partial [Hemibagrus guttatus]